MTPKIADFLATSPATPCLVLDVDRVEENYRTLLRALPLARVYYAVKANPAAPILERLVGLGSSFDAASFEEIEFCLAAGAAPARVSYGNTIKKSKDIRYFYEKGVRLFSTDSEADLRNIAKAAPGDRQGSDHMGAVGLGVGHQVSAGRRRSSGMSRRATWWSGRGWMAAGWRWCASGCCWPWGRATWISNRFCRLSSRPVSLKRPAWCGGWRKGC